MSSEGTCGQAASAVSSAMHSPLCSSSNLRAAAQCTKLAMGRSLTQAWSCLRLRRHRRAGRPVPCAAARATLQTALAPDTACSAALPPSTSEQYDATRTLYIGGLPWHADAEAIAAVLSPLCSGATHMEVASLSSAPSRTAYPPGSMHRGYALVAFRSAAQAHAAAVAVAAASAAGWMCVQGIPAALQVGPAKAVPASWPPQLTRTDAQLRAAAKQAAAAAQHTAHRKRRRQRANASHRGGLAALLESLPPPGGRSVAGAYAPLLRGLAMQLAIAGTGDGAFTTWRHGGIVSSCSPQLQAALRWDSLLHHVQHSSSAHAASAGPITLAPDTPIADVEARLFLDWSRLPAACDPAVGGGLVNSQASPPCGLNSRALRKRVQVESFALALMQLLRPSLKRQAALEVVDVGSGTGNLVVPLAALFPSCSFMAVDIKDAALQRLQARVQSLGLTNVRLHQGRIEDYAARADVVLALHACGAASDHALTMATKQRAAFIVSPCCIGKVNVSGARGDDGSNRSRVPRPRSLWMSQALQAMHTDHRASSSSAAAYAALARAADYSHHEGHGYAELAALAKANLELDRCLAAGEADAYHIKLTRLLQPQLTAKNDLLLGAPVERCAGQDGVFAWCWDL